MPDTSPRPIAFFAPERGDARVRKRIAALQDQGHEILGFTFHRHRDKPDAPPTWENVHLGTTYNRRYLQRLWAIARCMGVLWKNRTRLAGCGCIYVINTDNALLGLLGRFFAGRKIPLVLELADVQAAMLGQGMVGRVFRAIERAVLDKCALLVTTSPGFVSNYFGPVLGYGGRTFLLENKVYPGATLPGASGTVSPVSGGRPWVIGCFGALRCRRSLEIMKVLASRLGDRIRIVLRGYPAGTFDEGFESLLGDLPNLEFRGPYAYPGDLPEMYGDIDFNWAFDMSDPNGNSAWLLPNRIYEGGCFGVPAIGGKNTETGRWIEEMGIGWTFAEPLEKTLEAFFLNLTPAEWDNVRARYQNHPREEFTGEGDYSKLSAILQELDPVR